MGLSINKFTYVGDDVFDLNFALGYASRSDIACYKEGEIPQNLEFTWNTDSQVKLSPGHGLVIGDPLAFTRTVTKGSFPVDLTQPGNATRENLALLSRHVMYSMHELLDGRFGDFVEIDDAVAQKVNEAVTVALNNFLFQAAFKQDIVLRPTFTSLENVTYTSGGKTASASDVAIYIESPPNEVTELLVYSGGTIVFSATIDMAGNEVERSTQDVVLQEGAIIVGTLGDRYSTGLKAAVVIPCVQDALIDFDVEVANYVEIFQEARTT